MIARFVHRVLRLVKHIVCCSAIVVYLLGGLDSAAADLKVLFLGDNGHHAPKARADQLIPVLAQRGIAVTYTEDIKQLELSNLKQYAGLIVFANTTDLPAPQ